MAARLDLATCMDIFDWFNDVSFEYLNHMLTSKANCAERVKHAMPEIRKRARWLVDVHKGTEAAYPYL